MWVVGATTATRATRPSDSIRWATCSPKVVLPAAGVAEARKDSPACSKTLAAAACCHARSGRPVGQDGRERPAAGRGGAISYVTEAETQCNGLDGPGVRENAARCDESRCTSAARNGPTGPT